MNLRKTVDIRAYLQIVRRRKHWVIVSVFAAVGVGFIHTLFLKPYFEASATIYMARSRSLPGVISPFTLGRGDAGLRQAILSRDNLRQVIDLLGLKDEPGIIRRAEAFVQEHPDFSLDDAKEMILFGRLRRTLDVRMPRRLNVLIISARASSAEQAFVYAKTMTQVFIDQTLKAELSSIRSTISFNEEQLAVYKERLQDSEARLKRYDSRRSVGGNEEFRARSQVVGELSTALTQVELDLQENEDRLNYLNDEIELMGRNGETLDSPRIAALKAQLVEKMARLPEMMLRYSWRDPTYIRYSDEIVQLKTDLREEFEELVRQEGVTEGRAFELLVDRAMTAAEVDLLNQKKAALLNIKNAYNSASSADGLDLERLLLQQEVSLNRKLYNQFLDRARRFQIEEAQQRRLAESRFKILEPVQKPLRPVVPSKVKYLLMATTVGLLLGVGCIYGLEYIDTTFKNTEEVEATLALPILGTVPSIPALNPKRRWKFVTLSAVGLLSLYGAVYVLYNMGIQFF